MEKFLIGKSTSILNAVKFLAKEAPRKLRHAHRLGHYLQRASRESEAIGNEYKSIALFIDSLIAESLQALGYAGDAMAD